MASHVQDGLALLVVTLAALYLAWRARRFYLSMMTRSGARCGGCGSCGARAARGLITGARPDDRNVERTTGSR